MKLIAVMLLFVFAAGCSAIVLPNPETVINKPLGTESVKIGMTKDQVRSIWGDPDNVDTEGSDKDGDLREVWTYRARYASVPVDAGYLSKTKRLYFDGINLTKIE
ncbi:MAG: hypothetical protein ABH885_07545 [Candidatus Omnitrophota bacterium]